MYISFPPALNISCSFLFWIQANRGQILPSSLLALWQGATGLLRLVPHGRPWHVTEGLPFGPDS